jgi:ribonuclease BN (tRNA processing enzyme)
MQDFSLTCFGVGDGLPCGNRNHSSYLYRFAGTTLLVDCGDPISRSYKASGLSYDLVDRIFLSHLHADHIGGFLMLLQSFWLERRARELPVHLPAEGLDPLRRMIDAAYLFDELLPFRLRLEPLAPLQPVAQGSVSVTPHSTTHLDSLRNAFSRKHPAGYAAFSFVLEADGRRIAHTADLGAVSDLEPLVSKPLDLLVCELSHFEAQELFDYLRGRPVKHLALVHLARRYWDKLEESRRLAAEMLPELRISFPVDGEVLTL